MLNKGISINHDLLVRIARSDQQAFRALFEQSKDFVYGYAFKILRSEILAEETVQDVFIKLWNNRELLCSIDNFGAYMRVVTRNHTFTVLKQVARESALSQNNYLNIEVAHNVTDDLVDYKETSALFEQAINDLPPQQKLVYSLSKVQGFSKDEVAAELNISPLTVKSHLKHAVHFVRKFMLMRLTALAFLSWIFI